MFGSSVSEDSALSEAGKYLPYPVRSWLQFQVDCVEFVVNKILLGEDFHQFPVSFIIPQLLHMYLSPFLRCTVGLTYQHDLKTGPLAGASLVTWSCVRTYLCMLHKKYRSVN